MKLKPIIPEQSRKEIYTSHAGLTFLGQAITISRLDEQLAPLGRYRGIGHADIVKTYLGLLGIGKSDFEAAEGPRADGYFQAALGIERAPSSARLRQRMDARAMDYARTIDEANLVFLARSRAPVSPIWTGHVPLDLDLFPQDNSGTKKEGCPTPTRGMTVTA